MIEVAVFFPVSSVVLDDLRRIGVDFVDEIRGHALKTEVVCCDPFVGH